MFLQCLNNLKNGRVVSFFITTGKAIATFQTFISDMVVQRSF